MPNRTTWRLHELVANSDGTPMWAAGQNGTHGRHFLMVGDDGFTAAYLHESIPGGPVAGYRALENGQFGAPFRATSLESAFHGIRDAFRSENLDRLVKLN